MTDFTWTGLGDGQNWSDPNNWSPSGGPPVAADNATIGATTIVVGGPTAQANTLNIEGVQNLEGAFVVNDAYVSAAVSLTNSLTTNDFLSVSNTLTVNGGELIADAQSATSAAVQIDGGGEIDIYGGVFQETGSGVLVGFSGSGDLTVENGGSAAFDSKTGAIAVLTIGDETGSNGVVTVEGAGSTLTTSSGGINLGYGSGGFLTVETGATATVNAGIFLASQSGSYGELDVGNGTGVQSTVTVTSGAFVVGVGGQGQVNINSDGVVVDEDATAGMVIASLAGSTGDVSDQGSLTVAGALVVGDAGVGSIEITGGGTASVQSLDIARQTTAGDPSTYSPSVVTVQGLEGSSLTSTLLATDEINVGDGGYGALLVENAGTVSAGSMDIAVQATSGSVPDNAASLVTVTGAGSKISVVNGLTVGDAGYAELSIAAGGAVTAASVDIAAQSSSGSLSAGLPSSIQIDGAGSTLGVTGELIVGDAGFGDLQITNGGSATAATLDVARQSTAGSIADQTASLATVDGTGSSLTITGEAIVGDGGYGFVDLTNGATANFGTLDIAKQSTSGSLTAGVPSDLNIDGAGTQLNVTGQITVGDGAYGNVSATNGAVIHAATLDVGAQQIAPGSSLNYDNAMSLDTGAQLVMTGTATIGDAGGGVMLAYGGSTIHVGSLDIASQSTSGDYTINMPAYVDVSGAGSSLIVDGNETIGVAGWGEGGVLNGATATIGGNLVMAAQSTSGIAAPNEQDELDVDGAGSSFTVAGSTTIGAAGYAKVIISNGGNFTANGANLDIAQQVGSNGAIYVQNAGSTLDANALVIGGTPTDAGGVGLLSVTTGAAAAADSVQLWNGSILVDATGLLTIGSSTPVATFGVDVTTGALIIGYGSITSAIENDGQITASNGLLQLTGAVSGGGVSVIDAGAALEFSAAVASAQTIEFQPGAGSLRIDSLVGFAAPIEGFAQTDMIVLAAAGLGGAGAINSASPESYDSGNNTTQVLLENNGVEVGSLTLQGDYADWNFAVAQNGSAFDVTAAPCFCAGTRIATECGDVAVEDLRIGDSVMTLDGVAKPIVWIGLRTIAAPFADPVRCWPIRVKAGALGDCAPERDLLLSPDHALLVDRVLVHAGALVNGTSIVRETVVPRSFVYYHVELDDHSLIFADNVPAETFVDNVDRMGFDNWAEHEALFPEGKVVDEMSFPRVKARRQVPMRVRAILDERAKIIGATEIQAVA